MGTFINEAVDTVVTFVVFAIGMVLIVAAAVAVTTVLGLALHAITHG